MSEVRFHDITAQVVQFADHIVNIGPPGPTTGTTPADLRHAFALLDQRCYADAAELFREALRTGSSDDGAGFGLALALLQGIRPHRHGDRVVDRVLALLIGGTVPGAEALMLAYVVAEDHGLHWRRVRSRKVPAHVSTLAAIVPGVAAGRILRHCPAPEARGWRALAAASADVAAVRR